MPPAGPFGAVRRDVVDTCLCAESLRDPTTDVDIPCVLS
jgi:hypothetical protein